MKRKCIINIYDSFGNGDDCLLIRIKIGCGISGD